MALKEMKCSQKGGSIGKDSSKGAANYTQQLFHVLFFLVWDKVLSTRHLE